MVKSRTHQRPRRRIQETLADNPRMPCKEEPFLNQRGCCGRPLYLRTFPRFRASKKAEPAAKSVRVSIPLASRVNVARKQEYAPLEDEIISQVDNLRGEYGLSDMGALDVLEMMDQGNICADEAVARYKFSDTLVNIPEGVDGSVAYHSLWSDESEGDIDTFSPEADLGFYDDQFIAEV